MTVDVEEHFQVSAFERYIDRGDWDSYPSRVEGNTRKILDLFAEHNVHATFFILGWIAEKYAPLIRCILDAGHEVASHGYSHIRVTEQNQVQFKEDVTRTKKILEDACGQQVYGYRAASFSIGRDNLWALDSLEQAGYLYSSSINPVRHDLYGMPEAPRFKFRYRDRGLLEIPISTIRLFKQNMPCGGGGYFRLFPYKYFRWAISNINTEEKKSSVFYFHPWELDPGQPRVEGLDLKTRFRHYNNLSRMEGRLRILLNEFAWGRMDHLFLDKASENASSGIA